jgi:transcriptional regulator with XRE-family HTH domain
MNNSKAKRLATLVRELRGSHSQGQFAKKLGISRSTVTLWESGLAWPEAENLQKLAILKGWNLEEIQTYLIQGELPEREPLEEILDRVRSLPSEALARVATVAVQTLAERTSSTEKVPLNT